MRDNQSFPVDLLKGILIHLLHALDCLHTEANEKNILLLLDEYSADESLDKFEQQEIDSPSPRKVDGERIIHTSRRLVPHIYNYGPPTLCDSGQARFGKYDPMIDIQPYQYRAPEAILDIPWDEKVDISNVGVLGLFEYGNIFNTTGGVENKENNIYHLARMVALLGLLPRTPYIEVKGTWCGNGLTRTLISYIPWQEIGRSY
ncbi:hypothetical protein M422DRAFT_52899 [Sphaerobolus stellatus SS14]|uniref:Protein kinase domain-containing protein n=1 Tax=Sphaerobolus stellatus (strain SS14) TaxID=990650 RepID=A0A0C9UCD9_SPHS4|nr:hypothetical protein M422DRAFT_52899 [Sphaerobolus stellatus SS14]